MQLDVWDFALPNETHLPGDIWNGSMRNMPPEEEMLYYQLARAHRFVPLIYAYRPAIKIAGTQVTLDWSEFDRRLSPYLDGTAFTAKHGYHGPGARIPLDHMMLPFDIEKQGNRARAWPMALPGNRPYRRVRSDVEPHIGTSTLNANPLWRKVVKIAFLDGLDESYNAEAYKEKMLYYGKLLHESMGRKWFKYRINSGCCLRRRWISSPVKWTCGCATRSPGKE